MPGAERVTSVAPRPPEVAARSYAAQQSTSNNQLAASNQRIAEGQDTQRVAANVAKDLAVVYADLEIIKPETPQDLADGHDLLGIDSYG